MSITAAKGFSCAATAAGFKHKDRNDMALIVSEVPAVCAGTFTRNVVKAAPVLWDQKLVQDKETVRAIVVNSGIANACTGKSGYQACEESAAYVAQAFGFAKTEVLVSSTGVIGVQIPVEKIKAGVDAMKENMQTSKEAAHEAACSIMTTDTIPKEVKTSFQIGDTKVSIGGIAKGSGMIHPNMGTMLSFLTTDLAITQELLQAALSDVVEDTYNMISVDGDTSTNDTCLLLANGMAKNPLITEKSADYEVFLAALKEVCTKLAKLIAQDGEGATALFETTVINAKSKDEAKILAKSVISSSLTKAAIFGHDANWGRILCALGYSGVVFDPERVDITIKSSKDQLMLVKDGIACDYDEKQASMILAAKEVCVYCDMKEGNASASAWGCDLTYDYVKINADYRS